MVWLTPWKLSSSRSTPLGTLQPPPGWHLLVLVLWILLSLLYILFHWPQYLPISWLASHVFGFSFSHRLCRQFFFFLTWWCSSGFLVKISNCQMPPLLLNILAQWIAPPFPIPQTGKCKSFVTPPAFVPLTFCQSSKSFHSTSISSWTCLFLSIATATALIGILPFSTVNDISDFLTGLLPPGLLPPLSLSFTLMPDKPFKNKSDLDTP